MSFSGILFIAVSYTHLDVYKRQVHTCEGWVRWGIDPSSVYGYSDSDDAHHTFFECQRWVLERRGLELEIGPMTPDNIIGVMLNSKEPVSYTHLDVYKRQVHYYFPIEHNNFSH